MMREFLISDGVIPALTVKQPSVASEANSLDGGNQSAPDSAVFGQQAVPPREGDAKQKPTHFKVISNEVRLELYSELGFDVLDNGERVLLKLLEKRGEAVRPFSADDIIKTKDDEAIRDILSDFGEDVTKNW